jgi:hypothetical protein
VLSAPFVLERRSVDLQSDGTFTPEATVWLTPALLESGLLLRLTPTELQTLLLVLCGVTSNGDFVATSEFLAGALRLWPGQMRARLERLVGLQWQGEPLLRCQSTASGLRLFAPSPLLLSVRHSLVFPAPERGGAPLEVPAIVQQAGVHIGGGHRETVVEHSRSAYGRPRAEVEAEINRFLSLGKNPATLWPGTTPTGAGDEPVEEAEPPTPEEMAKRELARRLMAVGLGTEQARFLVDSFPSEIIERQLEYLPYRHARSPVGMLVASIEGDYAPPLAMRHAKPPVVPEAEAAQPNTDSPEQPRSEENTQAEPDAVPVSLPAVEGEISDIPLPPGQSDGGSA